MQNLTLDELREIVKMRLGMIATRSDCTLLAVDGIDLTSWLDAQIKIWYSQYLATAPDADLPISEIGRRTELTYDAQGIATAELPTGTIRVLEVKLSGWAYAVRPIPSAEAQKRLQRLGNPYCLPTATDPLAVENADGSLTLAPCTVPAFDRLTAVVDPAPKFVFHLAALDSLIEKIEKSNLTI